MAERLAVLGDVHANLAALQASLAAIDGQGIASGAFTGDLVMRGPDPLSIEKYRTAPHSLLNVCGRVATFTDLESR